MSAYGLGTLGDSPRAVSLVGLVFLCLLVCGPALAQYSAYGNSEYSSGQGYYGGSSCQPASGVMDSISDWFSTSDGQGIGRTAGGALGVAAGSFGGAALASSVIKAAGLSSMGAIAPILVGSAITAGSAFVGGKIGSHGGAWMDNTLGPDTTWTLVGAAAGAMAGFTLLPSLGPFAGSAGRVLGGALGGMAGGMLGKMFAPTLQQVMTTKTIYGGIGALVGGAGFGIPGVLAGAVGGYTLGSIFDNNFFSDGTSLRQDLQTNVVDYSQPLNQLSNGVSRVGNAIGNAIDSAEARLQGNSYPYSGYGYIGENNPYTCQPANSTVYWGTASAPQATGSPSESGAGDTLSQLKKRYFEAQSRYVALEGVASPERVQAYQNMMSAKKAYEDAAQQGQ